MKVTLDWLRKNGACSEGVNWFKSQDKSDLAKVVDSLMKQDHFQWANWTLVRFLDRQQKIQYSIFAAEQVINIFEKKYPDDKRPRKAIEAAKKCLEADTGENRKASAAASAAAAADASFADASFAASAAAASAASFAAALAAAAADARKKMREKLLKYGLDLLVKPPEKGEEPKK